MILRKLKKGFTIVELVIVIAVIAILTAILVPTFINMSKKANQASDQSLVKNLNTALKMQEAEDGEPNATMHDAVLDLEKQGYLLEKLVTKSGQDLLWNESTNQFELKQNQNSIKFWKIVNTPSDASAETHFSVYARKGSAWNNQEISVTAVGFDAGYNTEIDSVSYTNTGSSKTVILRTTKGALTIDAPADIVNHYGYDEVLDVKAVDYDNSFHEFGTSGFARVAQGHFVVESTGVVNVLYATGTKTGDTAVKIDNNNGVVGQAYATDDSVANTEGESPKQDGNIVLVKDDSVTPEVIAAVTSEDIVETIATNETLQEVVNNSTFRTEIDSDLVTWNIISSLTELQLFRDKVNSANSSDPILTANFKLTADVDLSAEANWTPISLKASTYHYQGIFDGNNKTISNMTITGTDGYRGLFGQIDGGTIKNVKFAKANVNGGERVGMLVGRIGGPATIYNCSNDAESNVVGIESNTGGLIAEINCDADVLVSNCTNYASVKNTSSSNSRAGGVVGQATGNTTHVFTFENCANHGSVKSNSYAGGIVCSLNGNDMVATFNNCSNDFNKLNGTYKGNIIGWCQNGHSNTDAPITITGYTGELSQLVGYFSGSNFSFQYFKVNNVEYMFRLSAGFAGSAIFGQTATVLSKAYHAQMDDFWNWVQDTHGSSFLGTVNVSDYAWFMMGLQSSTGYFNYGSDWYFTNSHSSGYNDNHSTQLSAENFRVTWTSDILYVLG